MKDKILNTELNLLNHSFSAKKIMQHPLFSGSFFMIFGSNFANFLAYLYHLILGRILGPASYGELVAMISLIAIAMSVISFVGVVIVKFVSSAKNDEIENVLGWFNNKVFIVAITISLIVLITTPFVGEFLHIPNKVSVLLAPILFFAIISFVYKSFLQGIIKFKEVVLVSNIELLTRLIFGCLFVVLGFSVFGATFGILLSTICGFLLAKVFLRKKHFKMNKIADFNWKSVVGYAVPVFIVSVSFTSLFTSDLVMVKHFFASYDAGIYGSVSNLGKIIFYGTAPIGSVMFPLIVKNKSKNRKYMNIFILSITLTLFLSVGVLVLYYLFPEFVIKLLYGDKYLQGEKYLLLMGIFYVLYSLANLSAYFLLSIEIVKPLMLIPVFAILQVIGIFFFHKSIWNVIGISTLCVTLLLLYLGIYFAYAKNKNT